MDVDFEFVFPQVMYILPSTAAGHLLLSPHSIFDHWLIGFRSVSS